MANQLILQGQKVAFKCTLMGIMCLAFAAPGFVLWQNGLAWHMSAPLTYGPLVCAGFMLLCAAINFIYAFRIRRGIKILRSHDRPL